MNYQEMQAALMEPPNPFSATQWHGLLCGLLSAGRPVSAQLWYKMANEFTDDELEFNSELSTALEGCIQRQQRQLADEQVAFDIVLPDDEQPLEMRTEALGLWCEAFLFGLAAGGVTEDTEMAEDSLELLQDMADISQVEFDGPDSDIEDELQYNELIEYIRVGVLLLNAELNTLSFTQLKEH